LPADRKTVLYAPTWTVGLSSAPMLGERTVELIRGDRRDLTIVIKPHPVTADHHPDWLATWRALAAADAHVHLIDDPAADVMPYLKAADVLISDASSVIFEYLALDRPIILLTNPDRRSVAHFDPNGIEWRWRDVGAEVHDVGDLPAAVSAALDNPVLGVDRRAHYRQELFGDYTDGRAAERIAQKITELAL
jgi:CDP-glycerol glycerophosphotransferase (TagB/SpsB family)